MFSDRDKKKALAIVHIFEASKPLGDYSAVAVLDDGAGISYGVSQFTHRSGSLGKVLRRFEKLGGQFPPAVAEWYDEITTRTEINGASANKQLKSELKALGRDPLMQRAQNEIAFENYLGPAISDCEGSDFTSALSLAVVYDSHNQGSYGKVRDRVKFQRPGNGSIKPEEFEREWIKEYCERRVTFLANLKSSAARASVYRPKFFLKEIARGNWNLDLPLTVHGHRLTEKILFPNGSAAASTSSGPSTAENPAVTDPAGNPQHPADQPPPTNLVEQTIVETEGDTVTATTTTEAGTVTVTAPEPYMGVGFWGVIKRDLAAATGGNLSLSGLSEYAQQASGWPEWVVGILTKVAVGAIVVTIGYFIFRVIHYLVDSWKKNEKTKTEAAANTSKDRFNIEWS